MTRRPLAALCALATASAAPSAATAGEPQVFAATNAFPWPGWYGPGPAGRAGAPYYGDWGYYGLGGTGPGISPGYTRPGYPGFFPGYFGVPGAAGSVWTNGFSLYGPPIPTYVPTPGSFGNADISRAYTEYPRLPYSAVALGVVVPGKRHPLQPQTGWLGQYSPSPRHLPLSVSVYPPAIQVLDLPPATTAGGSPCVRLQIAVPDPSADVWIEKVATATRGEVRSFESGAVEPGKRYDYEVVARFTEAGEERAESRTVSVAAGQTVRVEFGRGAGK